MEPSKDISRSSRVAWSRVGNIDDRVASLRSVEFSSSSWFEGAVGVEGIGWVSGEVEEGEGEGQGQGGFGWLRDMKDSIAPGNLDA